MLTYKIFKEMEPTKSFDTQNTKMSYIYDFHQLMENNNIVMIYEGDFSQQITKSVLSMTERKFEAEGVDDSIKKKIFNIMVESLQNICKHQSTDRGGDDSLAAIFMIGYKDNNYLIISGNPVANEKIENIKPRLDHVNSLNKDELKSYYKEMRIKSSISDVGGAGLGFIDMARKSGNKLDYNFEKINDSISFFTLMSKVSTVVDAE